MFLSVFINNLLSDVHVGALFAQHLLLSLIIFRFFFILFFKKRKFFGNQIRFD